MFIIGLTVLFFAFSLCARCIVAATDSSTAAPYDITDNVLQLTVRNDYVRAHQWIPKVAPSQEGILGINQNRFYSAHVIVGGQELSLAIDIGSKTTWVASSEFTCLDSNNVHQPQSTCKIGRLFDPAASQTLERYSPTLQKLTPEYSDGRFVEGKAVREELQLGGYNDKMEPFFKITQKILLAEKGYWKGDGVSNGVLGLAYFGGPDPSSVVERLFAMLPPSQRIFSLALSSYSSNPELRYFGGILAFGGVPDVPTEGRWVTRPILLPFPGLSAPCVEVDGFHVIPAVRPARNSQTTKFSIYSKIMAIASGIPKVLIPADVMELVVLYFGSGARTAPDDEDTYIVPCANPPRVAIRIKNTAFYIHKDDLLLSAPEYGNGMCILQLQASPDGRLVLGDAWLKSVVITFDYSSRAKTPHGVIRVAAQKRLLQENSDTKSNKLIEFN